MSLTTINVPSKMPKCVCGKTARYMRPIGRDDFEASCNESFSCKAASQAPVKQMLTRLLKDPDGGYVVMHANGACLGTLTMMDGGFHYFKQANLISWWSDEVLQEIADQIKAVDAEWNEKVLEMSNVVASKSESDK